MSILRKSPARTVRSDPRWSVGKRGYAIVFVATAALVYWLGQGTPERAESAVARAATATIHQQSGTPDDPATRHPDIRDIRRQILAEANLRRAVRQLSSGVSPPPGKDPLPTPGPNIETIRKSLEVSAVPTAATGKLAVTVTFTGPDPEFAAKLVNALAGKYVDDYRTSWHGRARRTHREAEEAAEIARTRWLSAKTRLGELLEGHFQQQAAALQAEQTAPPPEREPLDGLNDDRSAKASQPLPQVEPSDLLPPEPTDDSDWTRLNGELTQLRLHREELLIDRMPAHPEVLHTEKRIAMLEQELAATPRETPGPTIEPPQPPQPPQQAPPQESLTEPLAPPEPSLSLGAADFATAEAALRFAELTAAVDRAAEERDRTAGIAMQAWKAQEIEPRISLELARLPARLTATPSPASGLAWMALAAGIAAAGGIGLVATGAAIEPTLSTFSQAETILRVPILGTIPATGPATGPAGGGSSPFGGRPVLVRQTTIFGGLVLIAGCAGIVFSALGGF